MSNERPVNAPSGEHAEPYVRPTPITDWPATAGSVKNGIETLSMAQNWMRLDLLQSLVVEMADSLFPHRKPESAMMKLVEECGEVLRDPRSEAEWVDVLVLVLDLMNMHKVCPHKAIIAAVNKNMSRKWTESAFGTFHHQE